MDTVRVLSAEAQEALTSITDDRIHLILMPTEACNFRCTYCYEDFRYGRMEADVVHGVKRLLTRRAASLRFLRLEWFGGEPLLAQRVIDDIQEHALDLVRQHSLQFSSDITTNGFHLDTDRFRHLLGLDIRRYQVSLDGNREMHDRKRVLAGGGPTFDRIWSNLECMRSVSESFEVFVRLHVDGGDPSHLHEMIRMFARTFSGDSRFVLLFRPLRRLGGPADAEMQVLERGAEGEVLEKLGRVASDLGVPYRTPADFGSICYAAHLNSILVRSNGRLNKCTVALEHPNNQVGQLHQDGTISMDGQKLKQWMRGLWSRDPEELECPMRGYADPVSGCEDRQLLEEERRKTPPKLHVLH